MTDTTEPAAGPISAAPGDADVAALVLAFPASGTRSPGRRVVPPDGLVLGRDLLVFNGGSLLDTRMSRRHAEVRPAPSGALRLRDLSSKNGTWVRGERTREVTLAAGDAFRLGDTWFLAGLGAPFEGDPDLVGQSAAMAAVVRSVRLAAPHGHAVLMLGETGTGKEVAAHALHRWSGRSGRFVAVNCAALSEGVLESELFGHVRGAFTGAHESREGLFRAAEKGTLMLDEIGEMPAPLQAKLLRALDAGRIRPVGSERETEIAMRIVAATNADLAARVRDGTFRADLYARLAQWTIHLPALRERREDVPLLTRHLLAVAGAGERHIAVDLGEALLNQPWPLNVRGLRNVLSAALVACPHGALSLTPEVRAALASQAALMPRQTATPASRPPRRKPDPPDRGGLEAALQTAGGSVTEAARSLGASRQQVYRWAHVLGVRLDGGRRR